MKSRSQLLRQKGKNMQIGTMISGFRNTEIYGYGRGQRGEEEQERWTFSIIMSLPFWLAFFKVWTMCVSNERTNSFLSCYRIQRSVLVVIVVNVAVGIGPGKKDKKSMAWRRTPQHRAPKSNTKRTVLLLSVFARQRSFTDDLLLISTKEKQVTKLFRCLYTISTLFGFFFSPRRNLKQGLKWGEDVIDIFGYLFTPMVTQL